MLRVCDEEGFPRPVVNQPPYSLLKREIEEDVLPLCRREGIAVVPYQVLQGGLLTGKYRRGEPAPAGSRKAEKPDWVWELTDELLDELDAIRQQAEDAGVSMTHYAIRWTLAQLGVVSVVLGVKRVDQIADAIAAAEGQEDACSGPGSRCRTLARLPETLAGRRHAVLGGVHQGRGMRRLPDVLRSQRQRHRHAEVRLVPGPAALDVRRAVQQHREADWLDLAKWGRDFIVKHAYAGSGRWNYQLDRQGNVERGTISIFTDMFVLAGLCELALASGSDEDHALIRDTFDAVQRNVQDLEFKDIFHGTWSPRYKRHGLYMIALPTARNAEPILGAERTRPLIDHCLNEILCVFANDEHQALFESIGRDGSVIDEPEGRLLNPGHALESMWFCIEEGLRRGDRRVVERAIEIADWMHGGGHDQECGGIFCFVDLMGGEPPQTDWHKETGLLWHDKAWWVHSEALYALALAAAESTRGDMFQRFLNLHEWCWKHFYDP